MAIDVRILVLNLTGERSIALQPPAMRRLETYVRNGRRCGMSDRALAQSVARFWPSDRRSVGIETLPNGDVWVSLTPAVQGGTGIAGIAQRHRRQGQNDFASNNILTSRT